VRKGDKYSKWMGVAVGGPQGGVLCPLCWLVYAVPLQRILGTIPGVRHVMFADDLTTWAWGTNPDFIKTRLERDVLAKVTAWGRAHNIELSAKSKTLVISKSTHAGAMADFMVADQGPRQGDLTIPLVASAKLLGITISSGLSFTDHLNHIRGKFTSRLFRVTRWLRHSPVTAREPVELSYVVAKAH
jgi:hypothetical protein